MSTDNKCPWEVNDPDFWRNWAKAGGQCYDYIKETAPNYSLIGTLLLGFSLSTCLSPPDIYHISWFITIMNISTICSMALVFISIFMHSQLMCCYGISKEDDNIESDAVVKFGVQYGGTLITTLTLFLMADAVSLSLAILIFFFDTYNFYVFLVNLCLIVVALVGIMVICLKMQHWNERENYGKLMNKINEEKE